MSEASNMDIKVSIPGDERKRAGPPKPPRWPQVVGWIKSLNYSPEVEEELLKKARRYPAESLHRFRDQINQHVTQIIKKMNSPDYDKDYGKKTNTKKSRDN